MSAYTRKLYNQIVIIWKEHDTNNMCMSAIYKTIFLFLRGFEANSHDPSVVPVLALRKKDGMGCSVAVSNFSQSTALDFPSIDTRFPHLEVYSIVAVLEASIMKEASGHTVLCSQTTFPSVTAWSLKSTMTNLRVGGTQPLAPLSTPFSSVALSQLFSSRHLVCVAMNDQNLQSSTLSHSAPKIFQFLAPTAQDVLMSSVCQSVRLSVWHIML